MSELAASSQTWANQLGTAAKSHRPTARRALLDAFAELAVSRRYQELCVGLIVSKAKVARSTFYYHFAAKDDLLLQNLAPMVSALARLPVAGKPTPEVENWVTHIWEHRGKAGRILDGYTGRKIANALARELRSTLTTAMDHPVGDPKSSLLADQIAGAMLSLLRAWIAGRSTATSSDIAAMLWTGARALAIANATPYPALNDDFRV